MTNSFDISYFLECHEECRQIYSPAYGRGVVYGSTYLIYVMFEGSWAKMFDKFGVLHGTSGKPILWPSEELYRKYPLTPSKAWREFENEM